MFNVRYKESVCDLCLWFRVSQKCVILTQRSSSLAITPSTVNHAANQIIKCQQAIISYSRKLVSEFPNKILLFLYMISLAYNIYHDCFSASHNPKLRCVTCTGVHLTCTALSQSESSIFFHVYYKSGYWTIKHRQQPLMRMHTKACCWN